MVLIAALTLLQTPQVIVDNKPLKVKAVTYKGRMLVPMRSIFEAVGAYVEYNAADRSISARRNNETLDFRIGDKIARKNGAEIVIDVPPRIMGRSVMVPLRFVGESLGAVVKFDKTTNIVSVLTGVDKDALGSGGGDD